MPRGLPFSCTQCGDCCTGEPGFVWVTDEEIAALATQLGEPVEVVRNVYTREAGKDRSLREKSNGDCVFYDRQAGCTVYAVRPEQCRTWPFWESNVRNPEAWEATCSVCPGAGQGTLIPAEEITQRMRARRL